MEAISRALQRAKLRGIRPGAIGGRTLTLAGSDPDRVIVDGVKVEYLYNVTLTTTTSQGDGDLSSRRT